MTILIHIKRDDGYTLLETVVAMALFVSVLLPLGVAVGNLMLDRTSDEFSLRLRLAEAEMSRTMVERDFTWASIKTSEGYLVNRQVERIGFLRNVRISVSKSGSGEKSILVISKTF